MITKAVVDSHILCRLVGKQNMFSINFSFKIKFRKTIPNLTCRIFCFSLPVEQLWPHTALSGVASVSDEHSGWGVWTGAVRDSYDREHLPGGTSPGWGLFMGDDVWHVLEHTIKWIIYLISSIVTSLITCLFSVIWTFVFSAVAGIIYFYILRYIINYHYWFQNFSKVLSLFHQNLWKSI